MSAGIAWIPSAGILARLERIRQRHPSYVVTTYFRGRSLPLAYIAQGSITDHPYVVVAESLTAVENALGTPGQSA